MPLVRCEVIEGPRSGFKTIGVPSARGHSEYLSIEERFLARQNGTFLLPVTVIGKDRTQNLYLVQLPVEADSGANRVWVRSEELILDPDEVTA